MEIRLEHIKKEYIRGSRVQTVLDDVNATIPSGSFWLIKGHSGSGKSTLLNIISGLMAPTEGRVFYGEQELTGFNDEKKAKLRSSQVGIVTQEDSLIPYLTVYENINLPDLIGRHTGEENAKERGEYVEKLLKQAGIRELTAEYPAHLSGGEVRRASIVRALAQNPEVVILDEPTANLDHDNVERVLQLLRRIADEGTTVIIASHESEAEAYVDRNIGL